MGTARVAPDEVADHTSGNGAAGSHSLGGSLGAAGSVGGEVPANRRFANVSGRTAALRGTSGVDNSPIGSGWRRGKAGSADLAAQVKRDESLKRFGARVAKKTPGAPKLSNGSVWWALQGLPTSAMQSVNPEKEDQDQAEETENLPFMMIHPQSRGRVTWDIIVLLLLFYCVLYIPMRLCIFDTQSLTMQECLLLVNDQDNCERYMGCEFDEDLEYTLFNSTSGAEETGLGACQASSNRLSLVISVLVDAFFIIDIFLNFRTAYYTVDDRQSQRLVTDSGKITWKYGTGWFVMDVVGSIPVDFLVWMLEQEGGSSSSILSSTKILRIAKAFRLLRLGAVGKVINRLQEFANIKPSWMRLLKLASGFLVLAHVISCVLFWVGTYDSSFRCVDNEYTKEYAKEADPLCSEADIQDGVGKSWLTVTKIVSIDKGSIPIKMAPVHLQYVMSMYWAITTMTTVGYGDIKPVTEYEVYTCIICMFVGATAFSFVVGNMAALISKLSGQAGAFREKMDIATVFLHENNVPKDLKLRIRKYYDYSFNNPQIDLSNAELQDLSPALHAELLAHFRKNILSDVTLFQAVEEKDQQRLLVTLLERLQPCQYGPGDTVFHFGEIGRNVYFVINGEVDLVDPATREIVATFRKGSFFGENCLVTGEEVRPFTVRARSWSDICSLAKMDLDICLIDFPDAASVIRITAQVRWSRLLATIEAHRMISRARQRAHLVTGDTLIKVLSKAGIIQRRQGQGKKQYSNMFGSDGGHDMSFMDLQDGGGDDAPPGESYDSDDDENKLSMEEAELMADVKAKLLEDDVGKQLCTEVLIKEDTWDWSTDWVDSLDIATEAIQLEAKFRSARIADRARRIEKARNRVVADTAAETDILDLQDMAIRDLNEEGATIAPGVDLERVLERIVTRLDVIEAQTDSYDLLVQVRRLNDYLATVPDPSSTSPTQSPEDGSAFSRAATPTEAVSITPLRM